MNFVDFDVARNILIAVLLRYGALAIVFVGGAGCGGRDAIGASTPLNPFLRTTVARQTADETNGRPKCIPRDSSRDRAASATVAPGDNLSRLQQAVNPSRAERRRQLVSRGSLFPCT
jgi:hypothetical protein